MKQQEISKNHNETKNINFTEAVSLLQKKHYGFLSKIFCCKCFYCCQDFDFSLLTSKHRKGTFERMVKKYLKSMHQSSGSKTNIIMDPFFILVALLLGEESQIYNELLSQFSNPNQNTIFSKQDLEFYIPQLCTYLVFHEQMSNIELSSLLQRACKIDLHFSLRYYFFMKSLEIIDSTYEIKKLPIVEKYNAEFRNKINLHHKIKVIKPKIQRKISIIQNKLEQKQQNKENQFEKLQEFSKPTKQKYEIQENLKIYKRKDSTSSSCSSSQGDSQDERAINNLKICKIYNNQCQNQMGLFSQLTQLSLSNIYEPFIHKKQENYPKGLFESTACFFNDLVSLSQLLVKTEMNYNINFENHLKQINERLPAAIYIPLTKNQYQDLNILNIVIKESRVFKTKQRAPFKICFETFLNPYVNQQSNREKKIKSTAHSSKKLKRSMLFEQDILLGVEDSDIKYQQQQKNEFGDYQVHRKLSQQKFEKKSTLDDSGQDISENQQNSKLDFQNLKKNFWSKVFHLKNRAKQIITDKQHATKSQKSIQFSKCKQNSYIQQQILENASTFTEDLSIKTQNQKELKGLSQKMDENKSNFFEQSQIEGSNILFGESFENKCMKIRQKSLYSQLPGYKVVSLMIKSSDDLRQQCFAMQLLQQFERIFNMQKIKIKLCPYEVLPLSHNSGIIQFVPDAMTIDQLMKKSGNLLFVTKNKTKMKNFISSLVGYSLVTYLLQVKDRHNANIMIKNDGTIVHIDYGFFLSSMPGKGVELEKNVPFKLTYEYIDALGGLKSKQFSEFRKLFYQGFNALRKHQHRILILTKLMYSSYGTTMRCFEKGDESIQKFVRRFNPKNVRTDVQLSLFCQQLVNSSIQNWRAKWYDRWQYFAQGILY